MGVQPSEAKALTLAEYDGLMINWNKAHASPDEQLSAPSVDQVEARRAKLAARGVKVLT